MKELIYRVPNFRGKQRFLITLDKCFGPFRLKASQGVKIRGYLSSSQDASLCSTKGDCPLLIDEIERLPPNGVFVDCGANCGFYSALAAKRLRAGGKVISIEPSFREYERLHWATRNNDHECVWAALSAGAGENGHIAHIDSAVGHTGMNRIKSANVGNSESCPIMTLDFIFDNYLDSNAVIDLLKIDVEGYEMFALRGMRVALEQGRVKRAVVEVTDKFLTLNGSSKAELYEFMRGYGYSPSRNQDCWQYDEVFVAPAKT